LPELIFRQEYGAEFVQLAGALFKREWFLERLIDEEPPGIRWMRYWDIAVTEKTTGDYTVGAKVGMMADGIVVIADIVRGRWEWPDALKVIAATARLDGPGIQQGIESVGVQKGMYQSLMRDPALVGLAFRPVPKEKDTMTWVMPLLARAEAKRIALVRGAWNMPFIDEACAYPEVKHDDQMVAASGAMQMLMKSPSFIFL